MKTSLLMAALLYLWFMVAFVPGRAWGDSPEAWGIAWVTPLVLLACLACGIIGVARS